MDKDLIERITRTEVNVSYIADMVKKLEPTLTCIAANEVRLKNLEDHQNGCPIRAIDKKVDLHHWVLIGMVGTMAYLQKQALWVFLQRTFS